MAAAALVVDVAAGVVLEANAAACDWFGGDALVGYRLDRAMPAMDRIVAAAEAPTAHPAPVEPLLFWTPAGPKQITCRIVRQADSSGAVRVLLATADPRVGGHVTRAVQLDRAVAERTAPRRVRTPPCAAAPERSDTDTLREIARRIREGRTRQLDEPAPRAALAEPAAAAQDVHAPAATAEIATHAITPEAPPVVQSPILQSAHAAIDHAKLAHELRTPLSAIASLAEIMHDERLGAMGNSRYKSYAGDIHASARHALSVIAAMLSAEPATTDPEAGSTRVASDAPLDFTELDVLAVISECVGSLTPIAEQAGLTLTVAAGARMPRLIADRRTLKQILLNLLSNAIKFTPRSGSVTVATSYVLAGPVRIEVCDTGCGMSDAEIGRVFTTEPGAGVRDGERSGFGLPLGVALADANGASVAIGSVPGHGTRVSVIFDKDRVVPV